MATKEELLQRVQDAKDQAKIDAAYSASLTSTEEKPPTPTPPPTTTPKPKPKDKGDTYTLGGGRQVPVKPNEELFYDKEKRSYATRPKKMAKGGMTSSASKRADGIAQRGKTRA
jgi:hypothetical protein